MNRREFYKELMSEYTFDKDKILANAKKGKRAGRGPLPIYIGMTAAAAAIVVAAGTAVMTANSGDKSAVYIESQTVQPFAQLPDQDRINNAMDEIKENEKSAELHDVVVSFSEPLTPREAQDILTSYSDGNIPVKMVYLADGSYADGKDRVGEVFDNNTELLTGAVINCAGYVMQQLQQNERVLLVEIVTGEDLGTIAPIAPDESNKELTQSLTSVPESVPIEENIDVADGVSVQEMFPVENSDSVSSEDNSEPEISESEATTSLPEEPIISQPVEVPEPVITEPLPAAEQGLPDTVSLPKSGSKPFEYVSENMGAQTAYFLNENTVFIKTSQSVALYVWDGTKLQYLMEKIVEEPQVFWISENGSRLMVSCKENGTRSKIYVVDAAAGGIYDSHAENVVQKGTIVSASYNESANMLALNVYDNEKYNLITASVYDDEVTDYDTIFEGGVGTSVIAQYGGILYFSETAGGHTVIYKFTDGEAVEVDKFKGGCTVNTNCAFTHAVLNGGDFGRAIFDPESESLILLRTDEPVEFGVSSHTLLYGGNYYTVSGGELVSSEYSVAAASKIDYRKSFSSGYCAEVVDGAIRITSGVYNSKNMSECLIFEQPTENCTPEQRAALETGVGIQNALALNRCAESGITSAEMLNSVIAAGFSDTAASELKIRCGAAEYGELSYNGGGLTAIELSDCVLVMNDELNGIVYIKAGTFGGRTAYFSRGVRFTNENGTLRSDSLIEL